LHRIAVDAEHLACKHRFRFQVLRIGHVCSWLDHTSANGGVAVRNCAWAQLARTKQKEVRRRAMEITIESFRLLTDEQLLAEVPILVARERTATTVLIASLTEVDARKLFRALGYSSLFRYCTRELGLSEGSAYGRIRATRVARRFPEV